VIEINNFREITHGKVEVCELNFVEWFAV